MRTGGRLALVGDIDCAVVRFAISDIDKGSISHFVALQTPAFGSLAEAIAAYYRSIPLRPRMVGLSVAAPIVGETIRLPKGPWTIAGQDIRRSSGAEHARIVRKAEAFALALPNLPQHDLKQVGEGIARKGAPSVIFTIGADFGAAALIRSGNSCKVLNSEFDQVSFAAVNEVEFSLLGRQAWNHPTIGHILSGRGLTEMYSMFAQAKTGGGQQPSASQILATADRVTAAEKSVGLFTSILARAASSMALAFGARGGMYLGGDIAAKLVGAFSEERWRNAFKSQVCTASCPDAIPVFVITANDAGLRGAAISLADAYPQVS